MKKKTLDKRVEGLKAHAEEMKEKTEEKLSLAIDQMKKKEKGSASAVWLKGPGYPGQPCMPMSE